MELLGQLQGDCTALYAESKDQNDLSMHEQLIDPSKE